VTQPDRVSAVSAPVFHPFFDEVTTQVSSAFAGSLWGRYGGVPLISRWVLRGLSASPGRRSGMALRRMRIQGQNPKVFDHGWGRSSGAEIGVSRPGAR
jgi:hypothetical protein